MDTEAIRDLIKGYRYSKENILDKNIEIHYDPKEQVAIVTDFYEYSADIACGTCTELQIRTYAKAKDMFPGCHILRAFGSIPRRFGGIPWHQFLIFSESDLMRGAEKIEIKKIDELNKLFKTIARDAASSNPAALVDPCFKTVCPLYESGYGITRMVNRGVKEEYLVDDVLCGKYYPNSDRADLICSPLYINGAGELVNLSANFNYDDFLHIGFQSPIRRDSYPLHSKVLDRMAKEDPILSEFVSFFRDAPLIEKRLSENSFKKVWID